MACPAPVVRDGDTVPVAAAFSAAVPARDAMAKYENPGVVAVK